MKLKYYQVMAYCVGCDKIYPVPQSQNNKLCLDCKLDSLKWPLKLER